jgi:hypothetical protein
MTAKKRVRFIVLASMSTMFVVISGLLLIELARGHESPKHPSAPRGEARVSEDNEQPAPAPRNVGAAPRERATSLPVIPPAPSLPTEEARVALTPPKSPVSVTVTQKDLEERWQGEPHNEEWSANTRTFVSAMLESSGGTPENVEVVDCRRTLCRLELGASNTTSIYRMGQGLVKDKVPLLATFTRSDGGFRWTAFLAREGHEQEVFNP